MANNRSNTGDTTAAQKLTLLFSAVFIAMGILGFLVTGFDNFAAPNTNEMLFGIFEVNPLHNLVHLAFGIIGLMLYKTHSGAKTFGTLLIVGYGLVFLYGLFVAGTPESAANFLSLNSADNLLHLALALGGVAIVAMPAHAGSGGRAHA